MKTGIKNYISTMICILCMYVFYSNIGYYQNFFQGRYMFDFAPWINFSIRQAFLSIVILYGVLLIPFYYFHNDEGKALSMFKGIFKKTKHFGYHLSKEEKVAMLAWGVKFFFAPLMIYWLLGHVFSLVSSIDIFLNSKKIGLSFYELFNTHLFWLTFNCIFFIDVFFFTFGYLLESPFLKNTIKSVEPTILGWVVALMCYPPFNEYTGAILGWYSNDFPKFQNEYLHITMNTTILILMGIYSWASFALGLKASNLTNRGIITSGPYKYVRHPAYVAKNLAWWIGGLPLILSSIYGQDYKMLGVVLLSLGLWSGVYGLRAYTEEKHLSHDSHYRVYKKQVPYKFIPKVW